MRIAWIAPEGGAEPAEPFEPVGPDAPAAALRAYDHRIYVYADDPGGLPVHRAAQAVPGVVLLRDRSLWRLLAAAWYDEPLRPAERLTAWYGPAGRVAAQRLLAGGALDQAHFPLWEEALVSAEGLILAGSAHDLDVAGRWDGPLLRRHDEVPGGAALDALLEQVTAVRPFLALADRIAAELAELGIDARFPVVDRVAAQIAAYRREAA